MKKKAKMEQIIEQIDHQHEAPTNGSQPPPEEEAAGPRRFYKVAPIHVSLTVNVMDEGGNVISTVPFNAVTLHYPHGANLDLLIRTAEAQAPAEWAKKAA